MKEFFDNLGAWIYLVIFVGKLIEVSVSTLRVMFVSKGKKILGSICGLLEIAIWVCIAGNVLTDLYSDPFKALAYACAFGVGVYLGMFIEEKLAVGFVSIQIITLVGEGEKIGAALRENGFGVTILEGHSVDGTKREYIFVQLRRRKIQEANNIVRAVNPDAVISVSDVKPMYGGFFK